MVGSHSHSILFLAYFFIYLPCSSSAIESIIYTISSDDSDKCYILCLFTHT